MRAGWSMIVRVTLLVLLSMGLAYAQRPPCPPSAFSETQVVELIKAHDPDDRIVLFVSTCHIGFAPVPNRLKEAGASEAVISALLHDFYGRMTLRQAQAEVSALEVRIQEALASAHAEQDRNLSKLDTDYRQKRDQILKIEPQTKFEKDKDYEARVKKAQEETATLDRQHQTDRMAMTARYAAETERRSREFKDQIKTIKEQTYPVEGATLTFIDYDANHDRLIADVNGEAYWFTVPGSQAKDLYARPKVARLLQNYEEDESHTRYLVNTVSGDRYSGASRAALEKIAVAASLALAQALYATSNYEAAIDQYNQVLDLDRNNQTARDGISTARASADAAKKVEQARLKEIDRLAEMDRQRRAEIVKNPKLVEGTWIDITTGLMWTAKDNGKDITWAQGRAYCQTLRTGGFSDWRLGTVSELRTLYDRSQNQSKTWWAKNQQGRLTINHYSIHIKSGIALSRAWSFSSETEHVGQEVKILTFFFIDGNKEKLDSRTTDGRVLCVRTEMSTPLN